MSSEERDLTQRRKDAKGFDPVAQCDATIDALGELLREIPELLQRLGWQRDRLRDEITRMRETRDRLDVFTEDEAAQILKLQSKESLAIQRRKHGFDHMRIGHDIYYTQAQIAAMVEFFTVRRTAPQRRSEIRRAA